jgi:hypothetical protein
VKITSKAQFFDMWEAGLLGNRPHLWRSVDDAYNSGFPQIGIREIGKAGGGRAQIVPRCLLHETATQWKLAGCRFIMDSTAPNERTILCGEVCRTHSGLGGLLAERSFCSMREAQKGGLLRPVTGSVILALTQRYMDPSSREDLNALLELYPDAAVEFSCFTVNTGIISGRNTIFWEVRDY